MPLVCSFNNKPPGARCLGAIASTNSVVVDTDGERKPMVNVHWDSSKPVGTSSHPYVYGFGMWVTDPDGVSTCGGIMCPNMDTDAERLAYCQRFYPATAYVARSWRTAEDFLQYGSSIWPCAPPAQG